MTCVENIGSRRAKGTQALAVETAIALASGALPVPASSGLSTAYFLRNRSNECFAVIKPINDEPSALSILSHPAGSRQPVHASGTGLREVAAYILDHGSFSGVPPTALIRISHPALQFATGSYVGSPMTRKVASIQRFVPHEFDAGDLGPSRFSVASVHRIGILDVRLLNIDRHAGNILVRKNVADTSESPSPMAELVPIDHGLCLPELLDDPYFEWLHWPQAIVPFSEAELEYISALDPYEDAALLRTELPSLKEAAIRILILCTTFLKKAAAESLYLADIGSMMTREFCGLEEEPSMLEALCKQASDSIRTRSSHFLSEEYNGSTENRDYDADDDEPTVQFDMDCDDELTESSVGGEMLGIPLFLRSRSEVELSSRKKQKRLGGPSRRGLFNDGDDDDDEEEPKSGSVARSMSLSAAPERYYESGGNSNGKGISFGKLSEEEWGLFMERFEELLPEALEERKNMGLKQRLGSSCKF